MLSKQNVRLFEEMNQKLLDECFEQDIESNLNDITRPVTESYHSFTWRGQIKIAVHDNDPSWPGEYVCQVSEIHPYDDADYAWAKKDGPASAKIIQNGKTVKTINLPEWDEDAFETEDEYYDLVVDIMVNAIRGINKSISSRVLHN